MKFAVSLLVALATLVASPALAQGYSGHYAAGLETEPDTQALAFIRIPLSEEKKKHRDPVIGFGLFTDCSRPKNEFSSAHGAACEGEPIRSLQFSRDLYARDWLLSFSSDRRWVGIARWFPDSGFARVREFGPVISGDDRHFRVN